MARTRAFRFARDFQLDGPRVSTSMLYAPFQPFHKWVPHEESDSSMTAKKKTCVVIRMPFGHLLRPTTKGCRMRKVFRQRQRESKKKVLRQSAGSTFCTPLSCLNSPSGVDVVHLPCEYVLSRDRILASYWNQLMWDILPSDRSIDQSMRNNETVNEPPGKGPRIFYCVRKILGPFYEHL